MKKNKLIMMAVLVLSFVVQMVSFCNANNLYYKNGFAIGIINTATSFDVGISLISVMIPVLFVIFFMSGSIYEISHGYGKLLIIRNYSKTKIILKQYFKNLIFLVFIVLFQCMIFLFINNYLQDVKTGMLQSIIMYFTILHAVIMLQCFLELYMPVQTANIFVFIFCFVSYYVAQVATKNAIIKIILFPCLMFGMQNGATDCDNVYYIYLLAGIIINLLLIILSCYKFKKADIF